MKQKLNLKSVVAVLVVLAFSGFVAYEFWSSSLAQHERAARNAKAPDRDSSSAAATSVFASGGQRISEAMLAQLPKHVSSGGFVTSKTCVECHADQHSSWHDSYHSSMTQAATPETVLAPFRNVRLTARGRDVYLSQEGTEYFATMADPDWEAGAVASGVDVSRAQPPTVKLQVVMTTGSHHMQGYWVGSKSGNMLRQIPFIYLLTDKRWVPREDIFLGPPGGHRHFAVWNDNCLVCHSTAGNPNIDLVRMTVATQVAELGISCESCHGPAEAHVAFRTNFQPGDEASEDPVVNPAKCTPQQSAQICGQCHSYFEPPDMNDFAKHGYSYRAGGDLYNSHDFISYAEAKEQGNESALGAYWSDGTCRISGREFSSMLESPCYLAEEMSCISCHSMHNSDPVDQLADQMLSNQACVQCHAGYADNLEAHTHHAADSSGSLCYNCHMPHTTFGLLKGIRSHRIQSPRAVTNAVSEQPNACNLCHLDKTLAWTAEHLTDWYGQPEADLEEEEKAVAAAVLWSLRGDAAQRAVVTWHYNWEPALQASGADWQFPFLAKALTDDYAAVRYVADHALRRFSDYSQLNYDYVGEKQERAVVSQRLLEQWRAQPALMERQDTAQLLIDAATGQLLEERVQQLMSTRDNRDIYLPE